MSRRYDPYDDDMADLRCGAISVAIFVLFVVILLSAFNAFT